MRFGMIVLIGLLFCGLPASGEAGDGTTLAGGVVEKILFGETEELYAIPGIMVSLTRVASGERQLYACGESGRFTFPGLEPGTYRLEAGLEGYRTALRDVEIGDGDVTADLVLFPGVDIPADLDRLPAAAYELLVFQSAAAEGRSFRLQLEIRGDAAEAQRSEQMGELGEITFERSLASEELAQLRTLLAEADPLAANHRGSYVRPPELGHETLEVLAAGMTAVLVISGNPDFEEGAGRELIRHLHRLAETVVRRAGEEGGR